MSLTSKTVLGAGGGGGGTQYAQGTVQATPTGTVAMGKDTSDVLEALNLDASGNLKVNVAAGGASGGTSSTFGAAFPGTGTAVGAKDSTGANMAALNLDASGFLKVNVAAGGASGGTSSTFGAAVPGTGTAAGWSDGTNMQLGRVFDADSGAGTQYVLGTNLRKIASGGSVEGGTLSDPLRVDPTGTTTQPVSAASLPLPTGASTSALQTSGNASLTSLDGKVTACNTGAVVVSSSALPTGASTSALQTTGNTSLSSIDGKITACNTGAVVISSGAVAATQSGTWTVQPGNTPNTTPWLVGSYDQTDKIYNAATGLTPKFAFANVAASTTDGSIIAAVTSKKLRVLSYIVMAGGTATNVTFNSKPVGAGTPISMLHACPATGGAAPGYNPLGYFESAAGEGLTITTGSGSTVGVQVTYIEV